MVLFLCWPLIKIATFFVLASSLCFWLFIVTLYWELKKRVSMYWSNLFLLTILLSFSCFKDAVTVAFVSSCFTGKEIPDVWHLISPALFVEETLRRAAHLLRVITLLGCTRYSFWNIWRFIAKKQTNKQTKTFHFGVECSELTVRVEEAENSLEIFISNLQLSLLYLLYSLQFITKKVEIMSFSESANLRAWSIGSWVRGVASKRPTEI